MHWVSTMMFVTMTNILRANSEMCNESLEVLGCNKLPSGCCCEAKTASSQNEDEVTGLKAKCTEIEITPTSFPETTTSIVFTRTMIQALGQNSFNKTQLQHLASFLMEFDDTLESISARTFSGFLELRSIYIENVKKLIFISSSAFQRLPSLRKLTLKGTGLTRVQGFSGMKGPFMNSEIDITLSQNNHLEMIQSKAFDNLSSADFKLIIESNPALKTVEKHAFWESRVTLLSLRFNSALKNLDPAVFDGMKSFHILRLADTDISNLPTDGLHTLVELDVSNTPNLIRFPSSDQLPDLHTAHVTYPAHCCALNEEYGFGKVFRATDQEKPEYVECDQEDEDKQKKEESKNGGWASSPEVPVISTINDETPFFDDVNLENGSFPGDYFSMEGGEFFGDEDSPKDQSDPFRSREMETNWHVTDTEKEKQSANGWKFETHTVVNNSAKMRKLCKKTKSGIQKAFFKDPIKCTPSPDYFNPCENLLADTGLIVVSWAVALLAVFGNFFVILVLVVVAVDKSRTQQRHLSVPKFLILNLAFADFCMGIYVLALSAMDRKSAGEYYKYGVEWQVQGGCDVTGFLAVFSSQLSVYTLSVISLERWYAIRYAIQLDKRMTLKSGRLIMLVGWLISLLFAILPLVGVNSYKKTAVCLPMDVETSSGKAYIAAILSLDIVAFLIVIGCYLWMYAIVRSANGRERGIKEFFKLQQKKNLEDTKTRSMHGDGRYQHRVADSRSADARVAKRMAVLVFTDFSCFFPVCFFSLFALAGLPLLTMSTAKILLVACFPFNACCNPFLYAILTKSFRREARAFYKTHKYSLHGDDRQKASRPTEKRSEAGSRQEERRKTIQVYVDGDAENANGEIPSNDHKSGNSRGGTVSSRAPLSSKGGTYATCSFAHQKVTSEGERVSPERTKTLPHANHHHHNNNNNNDSSSFSDVITERRDVKTISSNAGSEQRLAISKRLAMLAILREFSLFKKRRRSNRGDDQHPSPQPDPNKHNTQVSANGDVVLCTCKAGRVESTAVEMEALNAKRTNEVEEKVESVVSGEGESYT